MKRMKGVAATGIESSPSSYGTGYEDPRTRIKYQSLFQDYEELCKETEIKKNKLEMLRQKKLTLLAEVRFLRRRHKYLTQTRPQIPSVERTYVLPQTTISGSKNVRKDKSLTGNEATLRPPVPRFDLNKRGKVQSEREASFRSPALSSDKNKKQKAFNGKEAALRNLVMIPDLNQKERICSGKEATARNVIPIFDLNQISMEEEELQHNSETTRVEEPKLISIRGGGNDEQHNDIKLSACRNIGNGSTSAGKRKISWQDQVALRV